MSWQCWTAASVFFSCAGVRLSFRIKYDLTQHPNYKYTSDYDKKNTFDIEKFLEHRLKLRANDEYEVTEV